MIEAAQKIKEDGQQADAGASKGDAAQEMVQGFIAANLPMHADLQPFIARYKHLCQERTKTGRCCLWP